MKWVIILDLTLDLECTYKGVEYKVVEVLRSDMLLVVRKDQFEKGEFPLQTYIIPEQW